METATPSIFRGDSIQTLDSSSASLLRNATPLNSAGRTSTFSITPSWIRLPEALQPTVPGSGPPWGAWGEPITTAAIRPAPQAASWFSTGRIHLVLCSSVCVSSSSPFNQKKASHRRSGALFHLYPHLRDFSLIGDCWIQPPRLADRQRNDPAITSQDLLLHSLPSGVQSRHEPTHIYPFIIRSYCRTYFRFLPRLFRRAPSNRKGRFAALHCTRCHESRRPRHHRQGGRYRLQRSGIRRLLQPVSQGNQRHP